MMECNLLVDTLKTIIDNLTKDQREVFNNALTDYERIVVMYPKCNNILFNMPVNLGKKYETALHEKLAGNALFGKRKYREAIKCYSNGIIKCPQTSEESLSVLTILIANRSASFYEIEEYENCLNDITYALSYKTAYPEHLVYKLHIRRAKCYGYMSFKKHCAVGAYETALSHLPHSKLCPEETTKKHNEIIGVLDKIRHSHEIIQTDEVTTANSEYEVARDYITTDYELNLGRFVRASGDIECGTTVLNESPICAVLEQKFTLTNCQHCMIASYKPIACPTCAFVVYCSCECQTTALSYHIHECSIRTFLVSAQVSINCQMALRIITQTHVDVFEQLAMEIAEDTANDSVKSQYASEVTKYYKTVYKLCRNEDQRKKEEYLHYTLMAVYLLRLLKMTTYFKEPKQDDFAELSPLQAFVGSLILRHLQSLQFNAHEISELQKNPVKSEDESNFKAVYIGGAVYQTLALFNHSCDPSIIRYNKASRMIVKAIKPIKRGQIIYENYGPIYTNTPREERKKLLRERYWFECNCIACEEDWPMFENMKEASFKIPCSNKRCSHFILLDASLELPIITCHKCQKVNLLLPTLRNLSELENILPSAELYYKKGEYDNAQRLYSMAIRIYAENIIQPIPEWVKVQQRLRTCLVTKGNKSIDCS